MGLKALLGFAPFIAFALIENMTGIVPALAAGFVVSLVLIAWEGLRHRRANILELGSALVFGGLTMAAIRDPKAWSVWEVRFYVDLGLAVVVFLSICLRRPFTMQSGRAVVSAEIAESRDFLRRNTVLSSVWGFAFVALAGIDYYMVISPDAPDRRGIFATIAVLAAAAKFTQWYVQRIRRAT